MTSLTDSREVSLLRSSYVIGCSNRRRLSADVLRSWTTLSLAYHGFRTYLMSLMQITLRSWLSSAVHQRMERIRDFRVNRLYFSFYSSVVISVFRSNLADTRRLQHTLMNPSINRRLLSGCFRVWQQSFQDRQETSCRLLVMNSLSAWYQFFIKGRSLVRSKNDLETICRRGCSLRVLEHWLKATVDESESKTRKTLILSFRSLVRRCLRRSFTRELYWHHFQVFYFAWISVVRRKSNEELFYRITTKRLDFHICSSFFDRWRSVLRRDLAVRSRLDILAQKMKMHVVRLWLDHVSRSKNRGLLECIVNQRRTVSAHTKMRYVFQGIITRKRFQRGLALLSEVIASVLRFESSIRCLNRNVLKSFLSRWKSTFDEQRKALKLASIHSKINEIKLNILMLSSR